ncbi:mitochondria-eating protein [Hemiscyllium ocellatum]|uniref:mitochondria-eating protein n=1 Tax=Hemiscyllium ocellatum TaxID=170820 RepID=UPI002966AA6F|nr:mitochondria-eating protein [Hemiscyllium ocellatum]
MADTLRRLVNTTTYKLLQNKLESWYREYHINSCDQNLNRCCELIELTSKVQGELFTILSLTASEGGVYSGVDTIKSRFLPWLGSSFTVLTSGVTSDTSLTLMKESAEKDQKLREQATVHEKEMIELETELNSTRRQLGTVKQELAEVHMELDDTQNKSAATFLATEDEIIQLRAELRAVRDQVRFYKQKVDILEDYERQIRQLKDEVAFLSAEKSLLQERYSRARRRSPISFSSLISHSPTSSKLTSASRHARLVSRFNDLYANERLNAQNLLRRYVDDLEMVQKIIFIATTEAFQAAKMAFRQFKLRVRKTLSPSHHRPESLDEAVIDYIIRNQDLYDVQSSIDDVIRSMSINPKISLPSEVDFILISSFIRDVCRVAFAMQTLEPPLGIAFTADGELFNEKKYRRSYDSDFTAPLVVYHIWPALMENDTIIAKGEAFTKRGALWSPSKGQSRSSSPTRSRSTSPARALTSRSRSPSPIRRSISPSYKLRYHCIDIRLTGENARVWDFPRRICDGSLRKYDKELDN